VVVELDGRGLAWLQVGQRGVLSRTQALQCGITPNGLQHRIRRGGPWQRLLPGVYLTATGQPTWEQLQIAALLHAGPDGLITGAAALLNYELQRKVPRIVDILIPCERQRASAAFVRIHRTRRMPTSAVCDGPVRFAPPQRAVADTARALADRVAARGVVASAVQRGQCTVAQLATELRDGPIRGSANLRAVLDEVIAGIRSIPEGDLRMLIIRAGLPQPLYNPRLYVGAAFLAQPDAWWPEYGVAVEVDSREWHLSPEQWMRTMARHSAMSAQGIIVLHFAPSQIRTDGARVIAELRSAIEAGLRRPALAIRTVPRQRA
jgi:hypothetical protein